ncbi:MAG TPA: 30S ribosome-binding factor RbfA [Acidimicrobiales bacterium]|nr:30S ribosome-binding factor RbfA [Acidimicrobiales bacterium]
MKPRNRTTARQYPRLARVNELLREIVGDELERLDVSELVFVTVTGVACTADLRHATVYFDGPGGGESDEAAIEALEEVRKRLQRAIATQARLKHTPELRFEPDPAVRAGQQIEAVLREVAVAEPSTAAESADDERIGQDP